MASATIVNSNYSINNDMLDKNDKTSKQIIIKSRNNIDTDLFIKFVNIHDTYTWLSLLLTHIDYSNQLSKEFDNNHHHKDIDMMKKISRYIINKNCFRSLYDIKASPSSSSSGVVMISNPMLNYKKSSQHVLHDDDDEKEKAFSDDDDNDDDHDDDHDDDDDDDDDDDNNESLFTIY